MNQKKIAVLIPAYNEAEAISDVIDEIKKISFSHPEYLLEILVIDNNSTDNTSSIVANKGIQVISEKKQGKGHALKTGFNNVSDSADFLVMLDGDQTYRPDEIPLLVKPLESNLADVVSGSRLKGYIKPESMDFRHHLANKIFTALVRLFFKTNTTDLCSGFIAFKMPVIKILRSKLTSVGFSIETEMIIKLAKLDYRVMSVPITYEKRGYGQSKISPLKDTLRILGMIFRNLIN